MNCEHRNARELNRFATNTIYACGKCGLVFNQNYRQKTDPHELYEKYYKNETSARFNFGIEAVIRLFRLFRAVKILTIHPSAKKILDIGCGRGFMLYFLKKYFKFERAAGIQISRNAVQFARNKLGLEIFDRDLLELSFENGAFDIITMWHVLEHLTEPEEYLRRMCSMLTAGGKLVIEVPNFDSWTRKFTGEHWLGLDPEYHVTYFSPGQFTRLFNKYGLAVKTTHTFSMEYSTFLSTQSIVSRITGSDHLFFRFLQETRFTPALVWHIPLFLLLAPVCFLVNVLLYFSKRGEVLLAEKPATMPRAQK